MSSPPDLKPRLGFREPRPGLELIVVLCIGVLPHLLRAIVWLATPLPDEGAAVAASRSFAVESLAHIATSIQITVAVLWVMRQSGLPWEAFGFRRPRLIDAPLGLGMYVTSYIGYVILAYSIAWTLYFAGIYPDNTDVWESGALARPRGAFDLPLILLVSLFNSFCEQLVITAFLVTQFRRLLGNVVVSVLLATALFASYHIYQGTWGVVNAVALGLVTTTYFAGSRRLWPCVVAHFFGDLVPMVLAGW